MPPDMTVALHGEDQSENQNLKSSLLIPIREDIASMKQEQAIIKTQH